MKKIQMILMTKSYKHKKYCVTGLELESGKWIRLVSSETHDNAISKWVVDKPPRKECLDIVEVSLINYVPLTCQTENFLINENDEILKIGQVKINDILNDKFLDRSCYIFVNANKSITEKEALNLGYSLSFVIVKDFIISCYYDNCYNKWVNKCSFEYNGMKYVDISLTDPEYRKEEYNGKSFDDVALVVSLPSESYEDGKFYKFVAKIFPL